MQKGQMQEFSVNHVQELRYNFCIIKSADIACPFHKPRRLLEATAEDLKVLPMLDPGATHYTPFSEVYVKHATERHRPSLKETDKEDKEAPVQPECPNSRAGKACQHLPGVGKPRVLHSNKMLKKAELSILDAAL